MTNYIKRWWQREKEKSKSEDISRIRNNFYLKEKNGNVWIMYGGIAIFKVPAFASSEETVAYLEESRGYAIEYAYDVPYEQGKCKRRNCSATTAIQDNNIDPNFFVEL